MTKRGRTVYKLILGDCLEVMAGLDANSVDAIVTDPPYGLAFMGKDWDHGIPGVAFWQVALRVAKPGAHMLAFGGTRTHHRLMCAIEDAGWEIRDTIMWVYGSGFPKSLDVSKAIDKAAGAERADAIKGGHRGISTNGGDAERGASRDLRMRTGAVINRGALSRGTPATPDAARWQGWGTALKPSWEPIIVARKPLCGTVAANVLRWGTGAVNVDACRVGWDEAGLAGDQARRKLPRTDITNGSYGKAAGARPGGYNGDGQSPPGRWPANLIHDGSDEVVGLFPQSSSGSGRRPEGATAKAFSTVQCGPQDVGGFEAYQDAGTGSAARFFYCAKASRADREEGMGDVEERPLLWSSGSQNPGSFQSDGTHKAARNHHPTVKPTALMRYLCRMVTPPGGIVLDPFMGSGSTGKAAVLEGFNFLGIEIDAEYLEIARRRIAAAQPGLVADNAAPITGAAIDTVCDNG